MLDADPIQELAHRGTNLRSNEPPPDVFVTPSLTRLYILQPELHQRTVREPLLTPSEF
jgi:hypothetical protein